MQVVPRLSSVGGGTFLGCQATRNLLVIVHQYQHEALTKPHSWFYLHDGSMEVLGNRELCNVEKVRVGAVLQHNLIFEAGAIQ